MATGRRITLKRVLVTLIVLAVVGGLAALALTGELEHLVEKILDLHGWAALALIFLFPALEASIMVGVVFPGETAVVLGGVLASQHHVSLAGALAAAIAGAIIGDQIGYLVGREWGEGLLRRLPDRLLNEDQLQRGRGFIHRHGAKSVIIGRLTAALRAIVPGLAGMSRMPYPRFLVANVIGGGVWAAGCVLLGYFAGNSWHKVTKQLGAGAFVLLAVVVVVGVAVHFWRHFRHAGAAPATPAPEALELPEETMSHQAS